MVNFSEYREGILKGLESLRGSPLFSEEYLSFRIAVFKAQFTAYERSASHALRIDRLPLKQNDLLIEDQISTSLIEQISSSANESTRQMLKAIAAFSASYPGSLEEIIKASCFGPDQDKIKRLSEKIGVWAELLSFIGRVSGAPLISSLMKNYCGETPEFPADCGCPYCGSDPGLAILRGKEGLRYLACSLCGMEWKFARMRCPFCGSGKSLGNLKEDASAEWIETCDECGCYLKTVLARETPELKIIHPLVEAARLFHLDLIAVKKGYVECLPYVAIR